MAWWKKVTCCSSEVNAQYNQTIFTFLNIKTNKKKNNYVLYLTVTSTVSPFVLKSDARHKDALINMLSLVMYICHTCSGSSTLHPALLLEFTHLWHNHLHVLQLENPEDEQTITPTQQSQLNHSTKLSWLLAGSFCIISLVKPTWNVRPARLKMSLP